MKSKQTKYTDAQLLAMPKLNWRKGALYQRQRKLWLNAGREWARYKYSPEVRAYLRSRTASRKR